MEVQKGSRRGPKSGSAASNSPRVARGVYTGPTEVQEGHSRGPTGVQQGYNRGPTGVQPRCRTVWNTGTSRAGICGVSIVSENELDLRHSFMFPVLNRAIQESRKQCKEIVMLRILLSML